ncbi:GNAT family N-acetyltransferase [Celerinatantimonas yamalensis]|uniref:N-acetyltransferase n=1 Tax=Celerinatantimonas yamalensis TaxID=559956 RepID=A0ABW9G6G5_9GAMM
MIASLKNTSFDMIHDAFVDAFSEYEVKMDMPKDKLMEMFSARSLSKGKSIGYFEEENLIGFLLIGYRKIGNLSVFYDLATGVRKKYQGRKIADKLICEIKDLMVENEIDKFVLEVLEHNVPAQNLYMKYGFRISRKFKCYEYISENRKSDNISKAKIASIDIQLNNLPVSEYCTFVPSWQNSMVSYLNAKNNYYVARIIEDNRLIGYGIVHRANGSILQLGMDPGWRTIENIERIVDELYVNTQSNVLKYLNVEENSIMEKLILDIGFKNTINQLEMEYKINVT